MVAGTWVSLGGISGGVGPSGGFWSSDMVTISNGDAPDRVNKGLIVLAGDL